MSQVVRIKEGGECKNNRFLGLTNSGKRIVYEYMIIRKLRS